ncbi:MAG: 1,4-dihydroxy-6-naphthoate synthase [Patescibacteria group bacterium]|jgi:1,4-dihydroxy-6-naphthoate synthase
MKLSLGFSPCPNDTFIFDAMIHGKVDCEGLEFDVFLEDVEALNQLAFAKKPDITKLSYHAYGYVSNDYVLLNAGSALGQNCGPLLISNKKMTTAEVNEATIAIPGKYTTANFLLSLAYPKATQKQEMLFSDIESAVLNGELDAGLIIHENRFTYMDKGLIKVQDLGEFWESTTQQPIPLGGIAVKRSLPLEIQQKVDRILKRSVAFALAEPEQTMDYVSQFAQEMNPTVMQQHIGLYVNEFTVDLGLSGKAAIAQLYEMGKTRLGMTITDLNLFVTY